MDDSTRVIVQGITGRIGSIQTRWMLAYGTKVVGGVTPGKGGSTVEGVPVFDSVEEAVRIPGQTPPSFCPCSFCFGRVPRDGGCRSKTHRGGA
jgi:succinyl-CoA synthetase alpha subunit